MTKPLLPISTTQLGRAVRNATRPSIKISPDGKRCAVSWMGPAGSLLESTWTAGSGVWSSAAAISDPNGSRNKISDPLGADGVLAVAECFIGRLAVRAGRRVPGTRPRFPSAGLIVSRETSGVWVDIAFADSVPDAEIFAATLSVAGPNLVVAYLAADGDGGAACWALQLPFEAAQRSGDLWQYRAPFPQSPGVAAVIAGVHEGMLIAAGGANFPDQPPWEGGVKRTYDDIYVLPLKGGGWRKAGQLPAPRAYAAVVSVPDGVLVIAGENAAGVFRDSFFLRWAGDRVTIAPAPELPEALASPAATVLDGKVYLAGGYAPGTPRASTRAFYCLDLSNLGAGWRSLPAWPGPTRALAVTAALSGAVYLLSGLEMIPQADGKTQINYLTDAYRYRPGSGWEKLPDLPWSAVAAPSPAPTTSLPERVLVFGGVDGRQVGKTPRDQRVPEDILYFDVARHEWRLWYEGWLEPVVTCPTVKLQNEWLFVSGETKAGNRTPAVVGWQPKSQL